MFWFKLKFAIRNLLKNKLYSFLIIGGFSLGFTACILIGLFYNAEHNVNTCFRNHKNIYRLYDSKNNKSGLDYKLSSILSEKYPEIENTCPVEYSSNFKIIVKDPDTNDYTQVNYSISTNNNFFDIFSAEIVSSISDKPFKDINSAVITESLAKRLYGTKNPLGRTIRQEYFTATVSAVMKDLPTNTSFKAELLLNCENKEFQMSQECENDICIYPTTHFILLKNAINPMSFSAKLNETIKQYNNSFTGTLALQKLTDIYLSAPLSWDQHAKGNPKMLVIFLSIGILIIILSSINYLNYTVSMQYSKFREIGINKTIGAGRAQLITDSLIEVSLGIAFALVISLFIATVLLPYTEVLFGRKIVFHDINYYRILPVFIVTVGGVILLNSLAPIYVLSRFNITDFLSGGKERKRRQTGRKVMLIFQLTVSIALLTAVMIIFKQLGYVKHYDLGFNTTNLVRIDLPVLSQNQQLIKDETARLPFVTGSSLSSGRPGWINLTMGSGLENDQFMVQCIYVSDDYLKTMGIQLLKGRDFLSGDRNKACIMNEAAAKKYGWDTFEGKKYNNGNTGGFDVVGLVKDFNVESLHSSINPVALLYNPGYRFNTLSLRLSAGNTGQQIESIREVWEKIMPGEPMEFYFYNDQFQAMYDKEEKLGKSISFFSFIAIILTCMGILAQIFLISLNRTKEIGVRKVNGAKVSEILIMLDKDFAVWVLFAFIIASPIAWYAMNRWLENFAYKTSLSWWIFALSGLLTMGITLLTVSWQSWKAATRNPVKALRYE